MVPVLSGMELAWEGEPPLPLCFLCFIHSIHLLDISKDSSADEKQRWKTYVMPSGGAQPPGGPDGRGP